ncbi:MAG: DUF4910 domain-containing protein [Caldilineales bacterium]|nr:DUF4910 domain-containing protein [Caldilineales bacterium]
MQPSSLLSLLQATVSGEAARRYVAEIARHHRIQASPGYREAAAWLVDTLRNHGLRAAIESFPATPTASFWCQPSFQEWHCRHATLDWLREDGEERLCDFRASPLSIIQRSVAVTGEFTVVDVGEGRPEDYEGRDVAGKLVLSRAPVRETYRRAICERGAAGILYDHIEATAPGRSRVDLPDARPYTSFWWTAEPPGGWGFVLTPRQGDALRAALAAGQEVRLRAFINAAFYDGEFEVVHAVLPGTGEAGVLAPQGVLGIAHLCHPQGFANDNASGAACLLETAIALARLLATRRLPPPRRDIHFLWVPEMTGTYAWLAAHEDLIPNLMAGINLDMVGERQETTGSVLVLERPPEAIPSFAPDLLEWLRDTLPDEQTPGAPVRYPRFRYATHPFSGGSDHMITSDPTVGIPTPMLIQWPDRFYHTTADTLEHVDPQSLQRAGVLAGGYLYWLARADAAALQRLAWEMIARYEQRLAAESQAETQRLLDQGPDERCEGYRRLAERLAFRQERMLSAVARLILLEPLAEPLGQTVLRCREEILAITARIGERCRYQLGVTDDLPPQPAPTDENATLVPRRLYRGPLMLMGMTAPPTAPDADRAEWERLFAETQNWSGLRFLAEYWADGYRTLAEIARLMRLETGRDLSQAITAYFRLLERAGLVELRPARSTQTTHVGKAHGHKEAVNQGQERA